MILITSASSWLSLFGHKIDNINLPSLGGKENDKEDWQRASASASSKNLHPGIALFYQVRILPMIFITNYDDDGVKDGNRDKVMDLQRDKEIK